MICCIYLDERILWQSCHGGPVYPCQRWSFIVAIKQIYVLKWRILWPVISNSLCVRISFLNSYDSTCKFSKIDNWLMIFWWDWFLMTFFLFFYAFSLFIIILDFFNILIFGFYFWWFCDNILMILILILIFDDFFMIFIIFGFGDLGWTKYLHSPLKRQS